MITLRERARASWTDLPSPARWVLLADLLSTAGSGIVLPFLAIYVGRVRDLGPGAGAAALAVLAFGCLPANLVAGAAADRYGARPVLVVGWVTAAAGDLALVNAARVPTVLAAAALVGFGVGTAYPATSTLLAEVTPPTRRPLVFATQYGLSNVGLSVGIGVSAVIVTEPGLPRFQLLYVVDAITFLIAGLVLVRARPNPEPGLDPATEPGSESDTTGYRRVLADRAFRWLCLVQILLVVFGYAQFHAALPIYLSRPGGLEPATIALVFAANTVFVALAALPAGRLAHRVPRLTLITLGATCFALSWLLLSSSRDAGAAAIGFAVGAALAMGLGEVLLAPSVGPLVNELSPAELRGRYNALNAVLLSTGSVVGPVLVAVLYPGTDAGTLFVVLVTGCLCAAGLTVGRLAPARVRV